MRVSTLNILPFDCICLIANNLEDKDYLSFSRTNKQFHKYLNDNIDNYKSIRNSIIINNYGIKDIIHFYKNKSIFVDNNFFIKKKENKISVYKFSLNYANKIYDFSNRNDYIFTGLKSFYYLNDTIYIVANEKLTVITCGKFNNVDGQLMIGFWSRNSIIGYKLSTIDFGNIMKIRGNKENVFILNDKNEIYKNNKSKPSRVYHNVQTKINNIYFYNDILYIISKNCIYYNDKIISLFGKIKKMLFWNNIVIVIIHNQLFRLDTPTGELVAIDFNIETANKVIIYGDYIIIMCDIGYYKYSLIDNNIEYFNVNFKDYFLGQTKEGYKCIIKKN